MKKFRAYDKQTNHMYYAPSSHIYMNIDGTCVNFQNGVELEVMFCVGEKDQNNKSVYAGDAVKFGRDVKAQNELFKNEPGNQIVNYRPAFGWVDFANGGFGVSSIVKGCVEYGDGEKYDLDFHGPEGKEFSWEELEVLGNIKQHKIEDFT